MGIPLTEHERREVLDAVALHGNQTAAARSLGIPRETFRHRLYAARMNPPQEPSRIEAYPARLYTYVENGCVVVFGDAHYYPGQASTAHRAMIECIKEFSPRGIVANGDIFDGASISRHARIGWDNKPKVKDELDAVDERLSEIEQASKGYAWKVWNIGNHDARFETYLAANAPQYEGVTGFRLKDRFPHWKPAWRTDINPASDSMTITKHRWKGGVHAVHNNAKEAGCHFVTNHLHAQKVAPWNNARGTFYGVDTGCIANTLDDHAVDYLEDGITQWRSGFALLTYRNGRLLAPELVTVVADGVVEFRGREWSV